MTRWTAIATAVRVRVTTAVKVRVRVTTAVWVRVGDRVTTAAVLVGNVCGKAENVPLGDAERAPCSTHVLHAAWRTPSESDPVLWTG